jgi:hypothetical protein
VDRNRGDDGVPASALGFRPITEPAPVRDFGIVPPAIVRPSRRYEPRRGWRCCPPQATSRATGCEPDRRCSAWLAAAVNGLATSLLCQQIELHDLEHRNDDWWPWPKCPQMIIRFGYGPPGEGSPRRSVEDILDWQRPE